MAAVPDRAALRAHALVDEAEDAAVIAHEAQVRPRRLLRARPQQLHAAVHAPPQRQQHHAPLLRRLRFGRRRRCLACGLGLARCRPQHRVARRFRREPPPLAPLLLCRTPAAAAAANRIAHCPCEGIAPPPPLVGAAPIPPALVGAGLVHAQQCTRRAMAAGGRGGGRLEPRHGLARGTARRSAPWRAHSGLAVVSVGAEGEADFLATVAGDEPEASAPPFGAGERHACRQRVNGGLKRGRQAPVEIDLAPDKGVAVRRLVDCVRGGVQLCVLRHRICGRGMQWGMQWGCMRQRLACAAGCVRASTGACCRIG